MSDGWEFYREKNLPNRLFALKRATGREVAIDVDWPSFGDGSDKSRDSLDYVLNMLASGLEGPNTNNPFVPADQKPPPGKISDGVERVFVKRVESMADSCIALDNGVLCVQFPAYSSFEPTQIEAVLLDRGLVEFNTLVTALPPNASPAMTDLRNHRLPAPIQGIARALGRSVPVDVDWNSLGHGFEAPPRTLFLLNELTTALRQLAREKPESGFGSDQARERAEKHAQFRSQTVKKAVDRIVVHGAYKGHCAPLELSGTTLTLNVFIDPTTTTQGKVRPDYDLRVIDACKYSGMIRTLTNALKLEIAPLLDQLKTEDLPKGQARLREVLDGAISKCRELKVPERVELRKIAEQTPVLSVDWESFLDAETPEKSFEVLKTLETGHYNYNCHYGQFLSNFFYALEQALGSRAFLCGFLESVKEIRCQYVRDPLKKELALSGSAIVLRQAGYHENGLLESEQAGPLAALVAMLQTGTVAPANKTDDISELETRFQKLGEQLKEAYGSQLTFEFDPKLCETPREASELSQRGILPVLGAAALLAKKPGYKDKLHLLKKLYFGRCNGDGSAAMQNGVLRVEVNPDRSPQGWPVAAEIGQSIEDGLALRARIEIDEQEKQHRRFWIQSLNDAFGTNIHLTIDWDDFLAHPTEGGNVFYPFFLQESGISNVLHALTSYMEDDGDFRTLAQTKIQRIRIASAARMEDVRLELKQGELVYFCFANMRQQGYLGQARLQERLYQLCV